MYKESKGRPVRTVQEQKEIDVEVWKNLFVKEYVVSSLLGLNELSPTYTMDIGDVRDGGGFTVVARAFRKEPRLPAHTIVVGLYEGGYVREFSTAVCEWSENSLSIQEVTYDASRFLFKPLSPELIGALGYNAMEKRERAGAGNKPYAA